MRSEVRVVRVEMEMEVEGEKGEDVNRSVVTSCECTYVAVLVALVGRPSS
jgi:hypothetical protein